MYNIVVMCLHYYSSNRLASTRVAATAPALRARAAARHAKIQRRVRDAASLGCAEANLVFLGELGLRLVEAAS